MRDMTRSSWVIASGYAGGGVHLIDAPQGSLWACAMGANLSVPGGPTTVARWGLAGAGV